MSKNGVPLVYGDAAHKHAVTSHNGTSYSYDANGCMVTRGSQAIKYDPESRPVRVDAGGTICRLAYDGDGVRRKRLDADGTVHYVGAYERNVGNGQDTTETVTKYYVGSFGKHTRLPLPVGPCALLGGQRQPRRHREGRGYLTLPHALRVAGAGLGPDQNGHRGGRTQVAVTSVKRP